MSNSFDDWAVRCGLPLLQRVVEMVEWCAGCLGETEAQRRAVGELMRARAALLRAGEILASAEPKP